MRSKLEINDGMLDIASKICYPFEKIFYQNSFWSNAKNVIDIGCGNANHIARLAGDNPKKIFTAIEQDYELAHIASERHNESNLSIVNSSFEKLYSNSTYDFLVGRRLIKYINNRAAFYHLILDNIMPSAGVLIIDTTMEEFHHDSDFKVTPEFYNFLPGNRVTNSKDTLSQLVEKELTQAGLSHVSTQSFIINTDVPGVKENTYIYMYLSAEYAFGSPLPPKIAEELFNWLLNPNSFAQFGMFGALFIKK